MDNSVPEAAMAIGVVGLVGFVFYLGFRRYQMVTQLRSQKIESLNRLIEKFGNAKEFVEFAQSPQGNKILEEPPAVASGPMTKVLRFVQAGILFIMIGGGNMVNAVRLTAATDINSVNSMRDSYYWGTLFLFIGVGCLIVGVVTYLLVQRWHLANGSSKPQTGQSAL